MKEVIQIEITKSEWKPNAFCMRIGDIKGSTEISNVSKEDLMGEISDEINELDDSQKFVSQSFYAPTEEEVIKNEDAIKKELYKDYAIDENEVGK